MTTSRGDATALGRGLTRDEAIEKALLYVFQLSGKDYRKMQMALSEDSFVRALEQDGYTVAPTAPTEDTIAALRPFMRHLVWCNCKTDDPPDTERCKCGLRAAFAAETETRVGSGDDVWVLWTPTLVDLASPEAAGEMARSIERADFGVLGTRDVARRILTAWREIREGKNV